MAVVNVHDYQAQVITYECLKALGLFQWKVNDYVLQCTMLFYFSFDQNSNFMKEIFCCS